MFVSFFRKPKVFLISAILFTIMAVLGWYIELRPYLYIAGLTQPGAAPVQGPAYFVTPQALFADTYFLLCCAAFAACWFLLAPHPYQWWSIVGTAAILFSTYFSVQVSVAINNWRGPFFDDVQNALSGIRGNCRGTSTA